MVNLRNECSPFPYHALRKGDLFGDFELLIDKYLNGDKSIKAAVAEADCTGGGFSTLRYHLGKSAAEAYKHDHVYIVCSNDGTPAHLQYDEDLEESNVRETLPAGISYDYKKNLYVVDKTVAGKRHKMKTKSQQDAFSFWRQLLTV